MAVRGGGGLTKKANTTEWAVFVPHTNVETKP